MDLHADPWDWTVDQVIHMLSKSSEIWALIPGSALPEAASFEHNLQKNDVNGRTLLNDVTSDVLKHDFKIASLGQRSAITSAIRELRTHSAKYNLHIQRDNLVLRGTTPSNSDVHGSLRSNTPFSFLASLPGSGPFGTVPTSNGTQGPSSSTRLRTGEILMEDATGRKRRKLTQLTTEPLQSEEDPHKGSVPGKELTAQPFLGSRKFSVDEVFFGKTKLGEELAFQELPDQ